MSFDAISTWFSNGDNALSAAQIAVALVTALATIALWRVTSVLAKETSALADMTSQPFVVCALESSGASSVAMNLTLRNTGNATAFNIELKVLPALPEPDGSKLNDAIVTKHEISLLPPGVALPIQPVMARDTHDTIFEIELSWAGIPNTSKRETISYKIEAKDGYQGGWNTKSTHHIAEELEKIRKQLQES